MLETLINELEQKTITPLQLVMASITKINEHNDVVNAVVEERFDKAILEAKTKDYSQTIFKGIPILIKALGHDLKDEKSTSASILFKDHVSTYTNAFVQRILDLGFIIIGQTNSPEFGFKNITDSELYGDAKHPIHTEYSPGGSSGGAAAALLLDFTPVVAGSDGGGSLRIPASHTGLVGYKPTRGSMPMGPGYRGWQGASMNFFLTKTVADTKLLFQDMYVEQLEAPFLSQHLEANLKPLKIAYSFDSPIKESISDSARGALQKTIDLLTSMGHTLVEAKPSIDGIKLMEYYYRVNGAETASMFKDIEKAIQRKISKDDVQLTTWAMYQYGLELKAYDLVECLNRWDNYSAIMDKFHDEYDCYITPTNAYPAPRLDTEYQDEALLKRMENAEFDDDKYDIVWTMYEKSLKITPFTMLANITGQPAISVPMHIDEDNFAMGVQIMAKKGHDETLFKLSSDLEAHFEMYEQ